MSANTDSYWKKIQDLEANPIGEYQSKWQGQIDNVLNQINNRKAFSYDFNADPLYQAYKDQYTKLGKEASMNAVANAATLTGGYGNSYAVTAGSQANQQYLTQLNNVIPELYNLAMNRYKMEGDELNNRYAVLGDAEDRDYGKHRDKVGDYKDQLSYLQGAYGTQLANDQWLDEYNENIRQFNESLAEQKRQFDLEYALKKAKLGGGGGGGGGTVYVNGSGNGKTTTDTSKLRADILKNALNSEIYETTTGNNNPLYKTPQQHLATTILANNIYQATADAVNNGEIPNTAKAQKEYIQDLTKAARNLRAY